MKVSYFPGCTLRTKAKELDRCARACAEILGFELCEIENWQCCGGVYVSAKDEIATKLAAVRALAAARDAGRPLVTVCSACHNVIKQTNHAMRTDEDFAKKVNLYLSQDKNPPAPYHGETEVLHYLELVTRGSGFEKIHAAVKNPLNGKHVAAYYGCMLLRPAKVIEFDDPQNRCRPEGDPYRTGAGTRARRAVFQLQVVCPSESYRGTFPCPSGGNVLRRKMSGQRYSGKYGDHRTIRGRV